MTVSERERDTGARRNWDSGRREICDVVGTSRVIRDREATKCARGFWIESEREEQSKGTQDDESGEGRAPSPPLSASPHSSSSGGSSKQQRQGRRRTTTARAAAGAGGEREAAAAEACVRRKEVKGPRKAPRLSGVVCVRVPFFVYQEKKKPNRLAGPAPFSPPPFLVPKDKEEGGRGRADRACV